MWDYISSREWKENDEEEEAYTRPALIEAQEEEEDEFDSENDRFEAKFNFRYEEDTGLVTHARKSEGLVRRQDESRKTKRRLKKEKQEQAKKEAKEELKRVEEPEEEDVARPHQHTAPRSRTRGGG